MGAKQRNAKMLTKTIPFRREFYRAVKEPTELPKDWLIRIKELAKTCGFGKNNDLFVFNKFIMGLENEVIEYLCSSAKCLDVNSSLEYIRVYEKQKIDVTFNATFVDQPEPSIEPTESIFSEIIVKCETDSAEDNRAVSDESCQFIDDNSGDSDFVWEDEGDSKNIAKNETVVESEVVIENENDKETKKVVATILADQKPTEKVAKTIQRPKSQKKKQKTKTEVQSTENADNTNRKGVDPNAPRTKRKYKKRTVKEKQTFECEICHYKCAHQCHLRRHKLIHQNEKSYICHMCGKGFNLFINLNAHLRRHIGYKPHSCDVCKASFMDRTRLRLHMRTHTGERPFECTVCDKKFADRYYLKVHTRLHTGEKPFQCDQCHKTFSQSSSLSVHKKKNCILGQIPCG